MLNIFGRTSHTRLLRTLIILAIVLVVLFLHKKYYHSNNEGFTQITPFIIKRNDDIYDDFYAQIYNKLYDPKQNVDFITDTLVRNTQANINKSVILVIGCESGEQINSLQSKGFNTFVIDKSLEMIDYAMNQYPNIQAKVGNIEIPMIYDQATFSHILCTGFMIYRIKDKKNFSETSIIG